MPRVKVQAFDRPDKAVVVEEGATKGATFGVNTYDEGGNVLTLAQLIALAADAVEIPDAGATPWRLLIDVPENVTALAEAAGTGIFSVTGAGTGALQELEVGASSAVSLSIVNPGGVAGPPMFIVDPTLNALAPLTISANGIIIGAGADAFNFVTVAANQFYARGSTGDLVAKAITDGALSALAGTGGTAGFLRGDGTVSSALTGGFSVDTNVLFVDNTNNRVGVNNSSPQRPLHVVGANGTVASFPSGPGAATSLILENNANSSMALVCAVGSSMSYAGYTSGGSVAAFSFTYNDATGTFGFTVGAGQPLVLTASQSRIPLASVYLGAQTINLTGNTDNLLVSATVSRVRFTSTGSYQLTGIDPTGGHIDGRRLRLENTDSVDTLTLVHDATSTAANRFLGANNANVAIRPNGALDIEYDGTSGRWRIVTP